MRMLMMLLAVAGVALGGEVNAMPKGYTPVGRPKFVPLYEIVSVTPTICKVAGSEKRALVLDVTFTHRDDGPKDITVACELAGAPPGACRIKAVKPKTPTRARIVFAEYGGTGFSTLMPEHFRNVTLRGQFTFSFSRTDDRP